MGPSAGLTIELGFYDTNQAGTTNVLLFEM